MEHAIVSPSPHIRSGNSTRRIMGDVLIALTPALIAANLIFGYRALVVTCVCVAACVGFEFLIRKIMKRDNTVGDLSAAVTGVLLAFNLPVTIPLWIAVIGCFFAIVVVKQLFGGIGQNFANPAITARVILLVSFTTQMTGWAVPLSTPAKWGAPAYDALASATPLISPKSYSVLQLFLGNRPGCIGETCVLALLLGFFYLVVRRVIHPVVPVVYVGVVFCLSFALGGDPVKQILSGGLILGAVFMATDYSTTPLTVLGKVVFAFGCGLLTVLIRFYGSYPEGVSFAILFMNILTPLIDRGTKTNPFGAKKQKAPLVMRAALALGLVAVILPAIVRLAAGAVG